MKWNFFKRKKWSSQIWEEQEAQPEKEPGEGGAGGTTRILSSKNKPAAGDVYAELTNTPATELLSANQKFIDQLFK